MKRDIIYLFIITFLATTVVLFFNEELKRNYEKGYNTRQVEIMDAIEEADGWCSESIERGDGTVGYVIDSKITLVDFNLEENRFNERIVYQCKRAHKTDTGSPYPKFGWTPDPIWIGGSRCECLMFPMRTKELLEQYNN